MSNYTLKVKSGMVKLSELHLNDGQIQDVPKNPRFIKDERFEALKKSIEASPEMMQLREIIAYDNNGELVIIMGNMRYRALKELGYEEAPCKILPSNTPAEKLREYTIKDNVPFGQNDWDVLANEWEIDELQDWGLECDFLKTQEDFDFKDVDELSEKTYKEPEKTILECPSCHHRDSANHFKKVSGVETEETEETEEDESIS